MIEQRFVLKRQSLITKTTNRKGKNRPKFATIY